MSDLVVGLGLALVIEGLLWGMFPRFAVRLFAMAAQSPEPSLRLAGLMAVGAGAVLVWLIRG